MPSAPAVERFDAVDVIAVKRDRGRLTDAQIDWVVDAYTRGAVADEQMSALAMAIYLNGMEPAEIARWTRAMIHSGERMDFSALGRPTADKHSTGGVGDKITLPLAPLVAAFGVAFFKLLNEKYVLAENRPLTAQYPNANNAKGANERK